jgi:hypothetical protein
MLATMRFLLIHSPLVTNETWVALVMHLETSGFRATAVALENNAAQDAWLFAHHIAQIESALAPLADDRLIAVAHSGAGNVLALLDPSRFEAHVFLDAIFPTETASRFELFGDPAAVRSWRDTAKHHSGMLSRSMLLRFGDQIDDSNFRNAFVASLVDVPVELYEEPTPVHPNWPRVKRGFYLQWTASYAADAARAENAGFQVHRDPASHFKMINNPDEVAEELVRLARQIE